MAAENYSIGPRPGWADPLPVTDPGDLPLEHVQDGVFHLMIDRFSRVADSETYGSFARKIVNEAGVQAGAEIHIELDPVYETITLHSVDVLRNGAWQPRLSPGVVDVLKRESGMESYVVDGNLTLVIRLPDIRPGDLIRYDFTRRGENPVMKGHFYDSFAVAFSQPFGVVRQRIQARPGQPLAVRAHGTKIEPVREGDLMTWQIDRPEMILAEDNIPPAVTVYPWVEVSDMPDWSAVVNWALPLYNTELPLPQELLSRISDLKGDAASQASAALRWVQDEVRYLGQEGGAFSHQPRPPSTVFEQRSGDCKEKVLLLVLILRKLGIHANPVLVNSSWRAGIGDFLPSPFAFDHVIAEVEVDGEKFFLDPTRINQRGPLGQIYIPDFGLGLRVAAGTTGLMPVGPRKESFGGNSVVERLRVSAPESASPSSLEVATVATGLAAERLRTRFSSSGSHAIREEYLDFYADKYPQIESAGPITTQDDPETNTFRMNEFYRVPEFWKEHKEGGRIGRISAQELTSHLSLPERAKRQWPFAIKYPSRLDLTTHVSLPEDWPTASDITEISNPWFRFSYSSKCSGSELTLAGSYEALTSEVTAEGIPEYRKEVERAADGAGYQLTHKDVSAAGRQWELLPLFGISATFAAIIAFAAIGFLLLGRPHGPPPLPPPSAIAHLEGLGGWLLVIGLAIIAAPITMLVSLIGLFSPIFSGEVMSGIGDSASPRFVWIGIVLVEVFLNTLILVFRVGLVPMFFLKRRRFPATFIAVSVSQAAFLLFDALLVPTLVKTPQDPAALASASQALLGCMIWVPYMLVSNRVRATFRL